MAAAYFTIDNPATTGKRKRSQAIGPNLMLYTGTWVANGTDTKVTIDLTSTTAPSTGTLEAVATDIYAYGVHVESGTITSVAKTKPNVDKDGTAAQGKIGILSCATDNVGTWWAMVVI